MRKRWQPPDHKWKTRRRDPQLLLLSPTPVKPKIQSRGKLAGVVSKDQGSFAIFVSGSDPPGDSGRVQHPPPVALASPVVQTKDR